MVDVKATKEIMCQDKCYARANVCVCVRKDMADCEGDVSQSKM